MLMDVIEWNEVMESQQKTSDARAGWKVATVIALLLMSKYLFIASRTTLWDRDEPQFARAAVEMVESGNYLFPTFNGQMWPDKPILLYWLMSVPIRLIGPTEFACRFWAAAGTALTCLLTFFIGQRLLGTKAGLWAMVILGLTLMMLGVGMVAITDTALLPFMVGALALFVHPISSGTHISRVILLGIALGAGMLAKGPIGVLPIPVIIAIVWLNRKAKRGLVRSLWQLGAALTIGVLIFLAWAIPANSATKGEFLRIFIGRDILTRAIKPMEHHGGNFLLYLPYYLPVIIVGFFPWTLHLPGAFSAVLGGRLGGQYFRAMVIGWIVPIFTIMTLAITKLPHYILFIWPALALSVAGTIVAARQNKLSARDRIWLRHGIWFFGPLAAAMALGLMIGPWFLPIPALRWPGLASGMVLSAMTIIAIYQQRADRPEASAVVLAVGMLVFEIPFVFGVLPALEQVKISPAIAQVVKAKTATDTPVATYKYGEPSLNFYIGRQIEPLRGEEAVVSWTQQAKPGVLIIPKELLASIQQSYGTLPLEQIASKKGFNYSKGKILEVLALIRKMGDR
jgi:4-amino-4-deoxy-L-arabinose transferase-like glycosyltransferase